jgi:hypothetical protein
MTLVKIFLFRDFVLFVPVAHARFVAVLMTGRDKTLTSIRPFTNPLHLEQVQQLKLTLTAVFRAQCFGLARRGAR